jgi:hypothetical protein
MWAQYLTRLGYWLDNTEFNLRLRHDIFLSQELQEHLWVLPDYMKHI